MHRLKFVMPEKASMMTNKKGGVQDADDDGDEEGILLAKNVYVCMYA